MPDTRTYYVICEDNCKFEGMTKEQIIAAIAEATGATPTLVDDAFISKIKEQNHQSTKQFWTGTEVEYNALDDHDEDVIYIISEAGDPIIVAQPQVVNDYNDLTNLPDIPTIITSGTDDPDENTAGYDVYGSLYSRYWSK